MDNDEWVEAIDRLCAAVKWADKNGLLYEFLDSFVSDLPGQSEATAVEQAVWHANREWDL